MGKPRQKSMWRKRATGEPLTPDEAEKIAEYHRQRMRVSTHIYWDSPEQKQEYEALAHLEGARNFSKWLIQKVQRGAKASPLTQDEVKRLYYEIDEANLRLKREAENGVYFREQARKFERERDEARERVRDLEERLDEVEKQERKRREAKA